MSDGNPVVVKDELVEGAYDRTGKTVHELLDNLYSRVEALEASVGVDTETEEEPAGSANHPSPAEPTPQQD